MLRVKERKAITLNYVTISPEFQFCSVHYNSTRMCTHYFQHPLIAHLMLRPHCVHTFESYVLRNFLAVCRYASIRLSGAHKSDYRRDRMMLLYMCGHHCEGRRKRRHFHTTRWSSMISLQIMNVLYAIFQWTKRHIKVPSCVCINLLSWLEN